MELIELRELQPEPRPGRGRLERANALRISPARRHGPAARPEPRLAAAPGTGHRFEPRRRGLHTWCDLCGDFIWGGGRKSLQCRHCSFTCHYRCRALVRLDCSGPLGTGDEDDGTEQELEKDTNVPSRDSSGAAPSRAGQRGAGSTEPRLGSRQGPRRTEPRRERATVPRRAGPEPSRAAPGGGRAAAPSRAEPQPKRSERSGAVRSRAGAAGLARGRESPCARAGAAAVAGTGAGTGTGTGAGSGAVAGGCGAAAAAALALRWGGAGGTGGSAASSGYCSQEDSDSEPELFYTARTSLGRRPRRRQDEPSSWDTAELDPAQVEQRIKEYNSQINSNLFMSLNKDGSFTGFIKVQLKLARPVSVPAAKRGPGGRQGQRGPGVKRRTSFYLPRGTVKHLHVLSHTRASEVISALLRKFTVVDDPRKFALFERSEKDDQVFLRKLSDEEQPLRLRLLAGPSEKALSFVLKENDSGEVNWDAFTLPELHNFLRILQREEDEQVRRVRHRYARCRREMQDALAMRAPR